MGNFFLFYVLFFSGVLAPEKDTEAINWVSITEVEQLIKDNPRNVFIDIYANWCGWCKVMDRTTFKDAKVISYVNENYYAVRIDAESDVMITFRGQQLTERELVKSFGIQGLPTSIFMDESLEKVKPVVGYQEGPAFLRSLVKFNK
ncbi:MAG: DUF255 domain-containing protein [Bacteroidetes bacterium]|nr:DUF255 domain-containing protein [Bacteroidota bacterium]MDA1120994.1 DUF255 domain-containing protein [Bacteroidota bacterium]